ncbi:hypothetical protein [Methylobacterium nonmethylotrophicum]|uniref:Uncharacterized protein n=1 Tax=Methylobacterium nonmethylotrophicum TaxID=1141884 RepID=A0A4Z0NCJ6_9HYPH|nr:hypothetical protein [Methylobacterium nonmethylotrophicum]TGD91899.1 hypothetical protein EU555_35430 [Methylobacterium nonmethylotrophicum]
MADAYLSLTDTAESRLSKLLFENGNKFRLLRRGADMRSANVEDALARLSALWPEARWARPGRTIVTDMAPPGLDWNDVRRRARP